MFKYSARVALALFISCAAWVSFASDLLSAGDVAVHPDTKFAVVQDDGSLWSGGQSWSVVSALAEPSGPLATVANEYTPANLVSGYAWRQLSGAAAVDPAQDSFAHAIQSVVSQDLSTDLVAPNATFAIAQPYGMLWSQGALWVPNGSAANLQVAQGAKLPTNMVNVVSNQLDNLNTTEDSPWYGWGRPHSLPDPGPKNPPNPKNPD